MLPVITERKPPGTTAGFPICKDDPITCTHIRVFPVSPARAKAEIISQWLVIVQSNDGLAWMILQIYFNM